MQPQIRAQSRAQSQVDPAESVDAPGRAPVRAAAQLGEAPVALSFAEVGLTYSGNRNTEAVRDFTLEVAAGERVAVLGPSGCGKSTLLALAAGLIEPTSGSVARSEEVALMPQRDLLVPWRSALANAALALEAQGVPRKLARAKAAPLFARFGLADFENSRSWELSGGMRQRVAFLRTMLTGRPLLALDEPFGALDSITRAQMQEWLIGALAEVPRTLLLVTHDIDEALTLCDRVVIVSGRPGTIRAELEIPRPAGISRLEWVTSIEFAELKKRAFRELA